MNCKQMEIDVVAESADGRMLLVGEAKLRLSKREYEYALAELKTKAELLPLALDYEEVIVKMFVADGGDFDCVDLRWCE